LLSLPSPPFFFCTHLAVDVPAHRHRAGDGRDVGLGRQDLAGHVAQGLRVHVGNGRGREMMEGEWRGVGGWFLERGARPSASRVVSLASLSRAPDRVPRVTPSPAPSTAGCERSITHRRSEERQTHRHRAHETWQQQNRSLPLSFALPAREGGKRRGERASRPAQPSDA